MPFYDAIRVGASGAVDFEVERSLRFNSGDSTRLTRTPSSATNRKTFTFSFWVKLVKIGTVTYLFECGDSDNNGERLYIRLDTDSSFSVGEKSIYRLITTQKLRDPSAWYHIVFAVDTTNSTADNRNRLYINGEEVTSFGTRNNFSVNYNTGVNNNSLHNWGRSNIDSNYPNAYLAEINFIDGQQLTPSSFGETNVLTGQWNPKKYSGSYGTNGYNLNFSDNSGTTATTLGKDFSGNGNNFTPNNFSVAANLANDSMPDTPTNNFCTLNPLNASSSFNFGAHEGNLVFDQSSNDQAITGTFFITSGKWYWEIYKNASQNPEIGICGQVLLSNQSTGAVNRLAFITNGGNLRTGSSSTTSITGGSAQTGAGWIRIACDMDNKKIWFSDTSGNYFNSGNPATGANAAYDFSSHDVADGWTPYVGMFTGSGHNCYMNFGQFELNSFSSNIPAGFATLSSANLPEPTIVLPNKQFNTLLWTGNATYPRTITGLKFKPDWFWTKSRSNAFGHPIFDSVRGTGSSKGLRVDDNGTEGDASIAPFADISSFNFTSGTDGGVTIAQPASTDVINGSGYSTVGWFWDAGETDGKTYTVTVVSSGGGNKYRFDGFAQDAVTLDLAEGGTYIFNYPSAHPFRFSTTSDGTHGGGSEYTTGVTVLSSTSVQIVVAASAPQLYYFCTIHSGMGGAINTNSTLGSSNFDGDIQTTVKVNATSGFSIVSFADNYAAGSGAYGIGHGLGVKPALYIVKLRNAAGNWWVWHQDFSNQAQDFLQLNSTNAKSNNNLIWGNTAPNSTKFYLTEGYLNNVGDTAIAYCFSEVAGYSKFGSYTSNQNDNGPFVYTGFRPGWILLKSVGNIFGGGSPFSGNWYIIDTKRSTFNVAAATLAPGNANAEDTGWGSDGIMDILSNGFKIRTDQLAINATLSGSYIYFAFAESPFKNSRAR